MVSFSEGFEGGTLGGMVSRDNTSFWLVDYEDIYPEDHLVRFTDDAYSGGLAATIPPDVLIAWRDAGNDDEAYQDMIWLGGDGGEVIVDMPVEIEWYYKFESGLEPYFGRYVFEAWFDEVGKTILTEYPNEFPDGSSWFYPDTDYQTHVFIGLEHSNEDVGDDPDGMYYYYNNFMDAYPELGSGMSTVTPQFPRSTWVKCNFTWQGAGLPFTMRAERTDTGAVLMDETHTAPAGLGLAYWALNVICTRVDASAPGDEWVTGYDFQNWFDGLTVTPVILGQEGGTRRRFT